MFNDRIKRAVMDGRFEETEQGLFVPSERSMIQGVVCFGKRGEEEEWTHNLIVDEGLTYLVSVATGEVAAISNWYVTVFSGDVVVQSSWTGSNFATGATEFTDYTAASRPTWSPGAVSAGARDSFASKASFESTVDGSFVRGAALISQSGKGSSGGTLMGATRFNTDKPLDSGEILDVGYGLQITAVV